MSGRDDGIVDLLALPAFGQELLAARPSLLFSPDGRRILLANPAGGAFFGAMSLAALRARRFAPDLPVTGQIARAARSLSLGGSRLERLRFSASVGFVGVDAECRRMALPDDETALLIRLPAPRALIDGGTAAQRLVTFLAGPGRSVAVLDAEGQVLAEGPATGMKRAGDSLPVIAAAAVAARPIHRVLMIDGVARPTTLLTLGSGPAALVLVLLEDGLASAPLAPLLSLRPTSPPPPAPLVAAETEPVAFETRDILAIPEPLPSPVGGEVADEEALPTPLPVAAIPPAVDDTLENNAEPPLPSVSPPQREEEGLSADAASAAFRFVEPEAPVRFVFQMDAEGRFTFISPTFAEWTGPTAAITIGENWSGMAARLGLDPAGAVASLIARRDTWSGVTLDWPVEGSDRMVAVDLAALPAFSRERHFEGYRGFGVIRASQRRHRPERAIPPPPVEEPVAPARVAERAPGDNVIRLPRAMAERERLSPPEQDAFRRIAAALTHPADAAAAPGGTAAEQAGHADAETTASAPPGGPAPIAEAPLDPLPQAEMPLPPAARDDFASLTPVSSEVQSVPSGTLAHPIAPASGPAPGQARQGEVPPAAPASAVTPVAPMTPIAPVTQPAAASAARAVEEARATERAAGAADLALARQRIVELEAMLDTATDGILVLDEDGRVERLNRSAEALFGVDASSVAGLRITELLAEESRQSALDYLDGLMRNGVASVLNDGREVIGRVPKGGLIPLFMTMGRLPETGKFCAVLRDITQWKNAEGELLNAKRAAESASMQKSDFLAKVSHEIRTPLNAIIGFSEVMMQERFGPIGTERYKEYLRDIHMSGAHLMSLLNDLLDLSKIEAGKLDLNFESVALNDIVMECVALMQPQANRERIIIRTSLSGQVPNVVADPRSMRQIVLNLVSNAVKFTPAGGQVIVSTAMEPHGEVALRIRDTGIGMSEKDIETALKPFRQLTAARERRGDGTGLGLPLTKALVEANRASFAIDSAVGQGTLIRITFPSMRVLAG